MSDQFNRGDRVELLGVTTIYGQPQTGSVLLIEDGYVHVEYDPLIGTLDDTISTVSPDRLKKLHETHDQ